MPDDLTTTITDAADEPLEVETDGLKVVRQSISDMIKADQYIDGKTAQSKPHRGMRITKLVPGDAS